MKAIYAIKLFLLALLLSYGAQAQQMKMFHVYGTVVNQSGALIANQTVTVKTDSTAQFGIVSTTTQTGANGSFQATISYPMADSVPMVASTQACGQITEQRVMAYDIPQWEAQYINRFRPLQICGTTGACRQVPNPTFSIQVSNSSTNTYAIHVGRRTLHGEAAHLLINNKSVFLLDGLSDFHYTFPAGGPYQICAYVRDGGCQKYVCTTFVAPAPPCLLPAPKITHKRVGTAPSVFRFYVNSGGADTTYWKFQGTTIGQGDSITFTPPSNTDYVSMCATTVKQAINGRCFNSICTGFRDTTVLKCQLPNATFFARPISPGSTTYKFVSTNGNIDTVTWSVNNQVVGTGDSINYTVPGVGNYNVCIRVAKSNATGVCVVSACSTINYTLPVCNISQFTISSVRTTPTGYTYRFTPNVQGANTYLWDVNQQTAGTLQTLTYTFPGPGTYSVCLLASNSQLAGCTRQVCINLTVTNPSATYSLNGMVMGGGAVYSGARVELIKLFDSTNTVRNTTSTPNGYSFAQITAGQYIVRAIPASGSGFIAAYHSSAATWLLATVITVPAAQGQYNITLIPASTAGGTGGINGNVGGNNDSLPANARVAANNITFKLDRSIILAKNIADNSLRAAQPDAAGNYSFNNLPLGTYEVSVDFPRVNPVVGTVTLTASAPVYTVNFDKTVAITGTGVKGLQSRKLNAWPNPARQNLNLQLDASFSQPEISLINSLGQTVSAPVKISNGMVEIATGQLPSGLYRVVVSQDGNSATASFMKE